MPRSSETRQQLRWAAVDALEDGGAVDVAGGPDVGVALLRDLLLDGELQRLFDDDAVEVVEVGLVLRRADQGLELLLVDLEGRVAVEEQGARAPPA